MSDNGHDVESQGAKPRDHLHLHHRVWRHARRNWWFYSAIVLMLALMLVYVISNSLSLRPGKPAIQSTPEANAP